MALGIPHVAKNMLTVLLTGNKNDFPNIFHLVVNISTYSIHINSSFFFFRSWSIHFPFNFLLYVAFSPHLLRKCTCSIWNHFVNFSTFLFNSSATSCTIFILKFRILSLTFIYLFPSRFIHFPEWVFLKIPKVFVYLFNFSHIQIEALSHFVVLWEDAVSDSY